MKLFNEKYIINSDELNSVLKIKTDRFEKIKGDDGKVTDKFSDIPVYDTLGYLNNIEGALIHLQKYIIKTETENFIVNNSNDIQKLIEVIQRCNKDLISEVRSIIQRA